MRKTVLPDQHRRDEQLPAGSVLVFGTFDLLHPGHISLLTSAAAYGQLIIALTPDKLCVQYKGQLPIHPYAEREQRLRRLPIVTNVVPSDHIPNSFTILDRMRPRTIVLGYDQGALTDAIGQRIKALRLSCNIVQAAPYRSEVYQSSYLREAAVRMASSSAIAPANAIR